MASFKGGHSRRIRVLQMRDLAETGRYMCHTLKSVALVQHLTIARKKSALKSAGAEPAELAGKKRAQIGNSVRLVKRNQPTDSGVWHMYLPISARSRI